MEHRAYVNSLGLGEVLSKIDEINLHHGLDFTSDFLNHSDLGALRNFLYGIWHTPE